MIKSKITTIEAIMLVLTIFLTPSILSLPKNLIDATRSSILINIVYVTIIAVAIAILIFKLLKNFSSYDIIDISEYLGGKCFKSIIGAIFILYFLVSSSILLRNFCECLKIVYYPMTSVVFIILAFIIATCLSSKLGFSTSAKVNVIVLPLLVFSVLFIFFANIKLFSFENVFPILGEGVYNTFITGLGNLGAFTGIIILYFLPPYLKKPEDMKKIAITTTIIAGIYLLFCVAIILFMFRFLLNVDEVMPLYYTTRYIEFGDFFQRLESFFLFIWILVITSFVTINIRLSMEIFKKLTNSQNINSLVYSFGLIVFSIAMFPKDYAISKFLESTIYSYWTFGVSFVLGIGILILANLKKRKSAHLPNQKGVLEANE